MRKLIQRILSILLVTVFIFSSGVIVNAETLGTVKDIQVNTQIVDNLGSSDEIDTFNFTLSNPGSIYINFKHKDLEKLNESWNVELQDDAGNKIINECITNPKNNNTNKVRIPAGTYYIKVYNNTYNGDYSNTDYNITAYYTNESSPLFEKEWNNNRDDAYGIDVNKICTGNLAYPDVIDILRYEVINQADVDYYKFNIRNPGSFYINFKHKDLEKLNESWNVELQDDAGNKIINEYFTNPINDNTNKVRIPAGTYYIKVYYDEHYGNFSNTDYNITACYTNESSPLFEKEWNNNRDDAYKVDVNKTYTGNLAYKDDVDYYKFNIKNPGSFYINIKHKDLEKFNESWNVELQDDAGNKIINEYFTNPISDNTNIVRIPAGTYYIKVYYYSRDYSNTDYKLMIASPVLPALQIRLNNTAIKFNTNPTLSGNIVMAPAQGLSKALGASYAYDIKKKVITIKKGKITIVYNIASKKAVVNGKTVTSGAAASINGNIPYVDVKFTAQNLGYRYSYDSNTKVASISTIK